MDYFVNLKEFITDSFGKSNVYRLYFGKSKDEIKKSIINDFIEAYPGLEGALGPSSSYNSFEEIAGDVNDYADLGNIFDNYYIEISEPYTDISLAIEFRDDYDFKLFKGMDADFYYYKVGDSNAKNLILYILRIRKKLNISFPENFIMRITKLLDN